MSSYKDILEYRSFWDIFFSAILTTVVAVVITLAFSYILLKNIIIENLQSSHQLFAQNLSQETKLYFEKVDIQLRTLANTIGATDAPPDNIKVALDKIIGDAPYFINLVYYDSKGVPVATSEPGGANYEIGYRIDDIANQRSYASGVYFTDRGVPYIKVTAPVTFFGETLGFIYAEYNLKMAWDFFDDLSKYRISNFVMVDGDSGRIVAERTKTRIGKPYDLRLPGASGGADKPVKIVNGMQNISFESGQLYISITNVPGTSFFLSLESPIESFATRLKTMQLNILIFMAPLFLFSCLVAYMFTRRAMYPITKIVQAFEEYGRSKTFHPVPVMGREYKLITDTFKKTTDQIEEYHQKMLRDENLVAIGKTVSRIAHEFRNSLHVILNAAYILNPGEGMVKNIITKSTKHMSEHINDLLNCSPIDYLNKKEGSLSQIMDETVINLRDKYNINNITIVPPENDITLIADRQKIVSALSNLVRNSFDANATHVNLVCEIKNSNLVITVSDNGCGIPPDLIDKIFDPFFTTKNNRFGIGLSIINSVIDQHSGELCLLKSSNDGATFTIKLPISEAMIKMPISA